MRKKIRQTETDLHAKNRALLKRRSDRETERDTDIAHRERKRERDRDR